MGDFQHRSAEIDANYSRIASFRQRQREVTGSASNIKRARTRNKSGPQLIRQPTTPTLIRVT